MRCYPLANLPSPHLADFIAEGPRASGVASSAQCEPRRPRRALPSRLRRHRARLVRRQRTARGRAGDVGGRKSPKPAVANFFSRIRFTFFYIVYAQVKNRSKCHRCSLALRERAGRPGCISGYARHSARHRGRSAGTHGWRAQVASCGKVYADGGCGPAELVSPVDCYAQA